MSIKRITVSFALVIVMGLTQWLIGHGIYDPNQPGGKPTTAQPTPQPTGECG